MDEDPESDSPAAALLPRRAPRYEDQPLSVSPAMTRLGTFRAYWLGCVVCMGGFLFGYDSGIIGRSKALSRWLHDRDTDVPKRRSAHHEELPE